ncbi:hypothetical protein V5O48_007880 [Marasmius crinis-equi]|uniref:AB hydrolase-1 domain-containing protein n=1 Tax=Marasmius crinis-equi TaxID=585013 RepID=A0ABR3FFE9_9AGAR
MAQNGYDDRKHPITHPRLEQSPSRPPEHLVKSFPGPPIVLASAYPPPSELLPPSHSLPKLPCGQRKPIWDGDLRIPYTLTTHIIPAAFWREDPDVQLPQTPKEGDILTKEARQKISTDGEARLLGTRREIEADAASRAKEGKQRKGQEKVLWLCLNRYVRNRSDDEGKNEGLTLFLAHANGFNKETWEPTLANLLSLPSARSLIQEIWVWDAVNHGDSALLNKGNPNTLFHWRNAARDLTTFFTHYIPSRATSEALPTHLPRLPQSETAQRHRYGFYDPARGRKTRTIVGIGHSFGGCVCTLASISSPISPTPNANTNFFSLLILVDPVILYPKPSNHDHPNSLAAGAFIRRSTWESRNAAKEAFLKSPFFRRWDPRVVDLYVEGGLVESPAGNQVQLKMSPLAEAIAFADTWTGAEEAWVRLWRGELSAKDVGLRWVVPGIGEKDLAVFPWTTRERVWLRPENAENVRIPGAGHLVPHEKPKELGEVIAKWIEGYFVPAAHKARL